MKRKSFLTAILTLLFCLCPDALPARTAAAQEHAHDSIRISLLTCAAGGEIYSLFGHTAIRYENYTQGIDAVFNYGVFDFDTPNFSLRFALGKTDYLLGASSYRRFTTAYVHAGRDVWQQSLNLSQTEKERLVALLEENYLPKNRMYRYNIFYDNCATRPRILIEKAIEGTVLYADNMTDENTGITLRHLLHRYSEGHPWSRFGMDLCMGSQADRFINRTTMMFVPFYLQEFFDKAQVTDENGRKRPLVASTEKVVTTGKNTDDFRSRGITPMQSALLLFIVVTATTIYGIRRQKTLWGIDLILFLAAGVAGCILAFLALFSQHPAVSPNYLLFVFHPLHLFCLPCLLFKVRKKKFSRYMLANSLVLTLFILLWAFIPQRFPLAVLPLALSLLVRSASNLILTYKPKL